MFEHHRDLLKHIEPIRISGRLSSVSGIIMYASGLPVAVGSLCAVRTRARTTIPAQVLGFKEQQSILMPLQEAHGVAVGDRVYSTADMQRVAVGPALLGRVVDGRGRPIDGLGRIHPQQFYGVYERAPRPLSRPRVSEPLGTGIRALDALLTVGAGQRVGIFSGTGVGKSILLGMITRYTAADVAVVALVGERGREVNDFVAKELDSAGRRRTVMVVSTSDESPVLRVRAGFVATAIAEYFRDQGSHVLLLMDSLTRVAMAQRQIGLATGEPPATKGYTPSVFSLMPQLLERSGTTERGSITGVYTVLVEGDDAADPIADAVRGILDGHVWLSRELSGRGHYPPIDVLDSISRLMIDVVDEEHLTAAQRLRQVLATWREIEDLVNIGAYEQGSNPQFDLAIRMKPQIDEFLRQAIDERVDFAEARGRLLELADTIDGTHDKPRRA